MTDRATMSRRATASPGRDRALGGVGGHVWAPHVARSALVAGAVTIAVVLLRWWDKSAGDVLICAGWIGAGAVLARGLPASVTRRSVSAILLAVAALEALRLRGFAVMPDGVAVDFAPELEATRVLFDAGGDPYSVHAAIWFPFPAFWLIRGLSLGGLVDAHGTWLAFFALSVLALGGAVACLLRLTRDHGDASRLPRWLVLAALLLHPSVVQSLVFGQTGPLVMLVVALGFLAWRDGWAMPWLPGLCVALAWMLKPHLIVPGAFFVAAWWWKPGSDAGRIGRAQVLWALGIIGTLVVVPGGVTLETLRSFVVAAGSHHRTWAQMWDQNFSLVAILAHGGGVERAIGPAAMIALLAVLGVGLACLRASRSPAMSAHAWTVASLVPFAAIWRHYYIWIVPAAFVTLLATSRASVRPQLTLAAFAAVGLLNLVASPAFSVGVLMLLVVVHVVAATGETGDAAVIRTTEESTVMVTA